jgi:hypothetical protein
MGTFFIFIMTSQTRHEKGLEWAAERPGFSR